MGEFDRLLEVANGLSFNPYDIISKLDRTGQYRLDLSNEFPFLVTLYWLDSSYYTRQATWHERLEVLMPLDGPLRMKVGEELVDLSPGDVLLIDCLKLHQVIDFPGFGTRVIVLAFMPGFVYSLGSPTYDYIFLLPFFTRSRKHPYVVRAVDSGTDEIYYAARKLLELFFLSPDGHYKESGCKAWCLVLLQQMVDRFEPAEMVESEFRKHEEQARRLQPVFELIRSRYQQRLYLREVATMVNLSVPQFVRVFKEVAGMPFIAYVNHVRLSRAVDLLRSTDQSIGHIAQCVGFDDQNYFDRRFKKSFGYSPQKFRSLIRQHRAWKE